VSETTSDVLTERQRLLHGELVHLVHEALDQYDAGYAVDLEQQYIEFARRWADAPD
jgi:hypothetical protein